VTNKIVDADVDDFIVVVGFFTLFVKALYCTVAVLYFKFSQQMILRGSNAKCCQHRHIFCNSKIFGNDFQSRTLEFNVYILNLN
jgi:hypothetical protein